MSQKTALDTAIAEAERFLERARTLRAALKANEGVEYRARRYSFPERSATRRASMDLTRALAALRRAP